MEFITAYEQTRCYTCGAAAMLTALHELTGMELTADNEIAIWKRAHLPGYWGSLPGMLALIARRAGLDSRVVYAPVNVRQLLRGSSLLRKVEYALALSFNRLMLRRARGQGIEVRELPEAEDDLAMILSHLARVPRLRVMTVIKVGDYDVHYVLSRLCADGRIAVMDPAYGENFVFTPGEFVNSYRGVNLRIHVMMEAAGGTHCGS